MVTVSPTSTNCCARMIVSNLIYDCNIVRCLSRGVVDVNCLRFNGVVQGYVIS